MRKNYLKNIFFEECIDKNINFFLLSWKKLIYSFKKKREKEFMRIKIKKSNIDLKEFSMCFSLKDY